MNRTEKRIAAIIAATVAASTAAVVLPVTAALNARLDNIETRLAEIPAAAEVSPEAGVARQMEPQEADAPEFQNLGTFKLTAYCACPECCGNWADGITFTGTEATPGRTIAVDPDVIPLGSTVEINGQTYVAEDIGGAIQGNRIDIFFPSHADALQFGVQHAEVLLNT